MANLTEASIIVLQHVLQINDVESRKRNKATVKSEDLCCEDDPESHEFTLEALFGSETRNFLSVYAHATVSLK